MVFSRFTCTNKPSKVLAIALFGTLAGCGDESPPYESLPLRDALRAAPEVMATLSEQSRRELALRLLDAERVESETLTFEPETLNLEPLVSSADAVREASGKDALMLGEILATEGHGLLEIHVSAEFDMVNAPVVEVLGKASDIAAPFEQAALAGQAGTTLRGFVARTHAKSIVRMTGLPVGAVAWNDKVFVNESWLVALSALEDECVAIPEPEVPRESGPTAAIEPLSVDFSPYDLPGTLTECLLQVQKTCACGQTMSCSHEPTDQTFSDANAECNWVNQQSANASAICILALLSLDAVKECVESASPACSFVPVNNRDGAVLFATDTRCVSILDSCLQDGSPTSPVDNVSSSGDSCDDCRYCDNKGNDCQECLTDCQTCADAVEVCVEICAICADSAEREASAKEGSFKYAAVRPVTQCRVRSPAGRSPLPAPVGMAFWLFAPVAYLLSRSRRRM